MIEGDHDPWHYTVEWELVNPKTELIEQKMDIDDIKEKFVWPMERIVDGERVLILFPRKSDEESLKTLKEMDIERIWVTQKIPFIVFITGGFIISVFFGNVFAAFMGLMG